MKKILIPIILILCINIVYAWEWDNVKSYDIDTKTITIKDSLLGVPTTTVATIKLLSPSHVFVIRGEERLVQEYLINLSESSYTDFFKEFNIYKVTNGQKTTRNYKIKSWEYSDTIKVNTYNKTCSNVRGADGIYRESCTLTKNGTVETDIYEWKLIDKLDLVKGVKRIGVFAEVEPGDYMDGVPKLFGVDINEWATWQDSYSVGLAYYFKLNETSGTNAIESVYGSNGTYNGSVTINVNGKIDKAIQTDGTASKGMFKNGLIRGIKDNLPNAVSFWFNATNVDTDEYTMTFYQDGSTNTRAIRVSNSGGVKIGYRGGGACDSYGTTALSQNVWHFVVSNFNGTAINLTMDGVQAFTCTETQNLGSMSLMAGGWFSGSYGFKGVIDEIGIWNRTLTHAEITDMATGMTYYYAPPETDSMTINQYYPTGGLNLSSQNVDFKCNFTGGGSNNITQVNLRVYNSSTNLVYSNSETGLNLKSYNKTWTSVNLENEGIFNWSCSAIGSISINSTSSNISFRVDTLNPTVLINEPSTNITGNSLPTNVNLNATSSDANLYYCYYYTSLNLTKTNYTCNTIASVPYAIDTLQNVTAGVYDYSGHNAETTRSFYISIISDNQTINNNISSEGMINIVTLSVYYTSSIPDIEANLWWNGTNYGRGSRTKVSNNQYDFLNSFTIPLRTGNSSGNKIKWNWVYNVSGSVSVINTSVQNQTVYNITIDDCTTNTKLILNQTLYDEDTKTIIIPNVTNANTTIETDFYLYSISDNSIYWHYSNSKNNTNFSKICMPENVFYGNSSYSATSSTKYFTSNRVTEYYNLQNETIDNTTIPKNIKLYDLSSTNSQEFLITYKDYYLTPVSSVLIKIYRKYTGDGSSELVEVPITDSDGRTIGHFVLNDVLYDIYAVKNGQYLASWTNVRSYCASSECYLNLNELSSSTSPTQIDSSIGLMYLGKYNASSRTYKLTYSSLDGSNKNVNLSLYIIDINNTTPICSDTAYSSSDILQCVLGFSSENKTIKALLSVNGEVKAQDIFNSGTSNIDDTTKYFIAIILIAFLPLMAIGSPVVTLILFGVGIILSTISLLVTEITIVGSGSLILWIVLAGILLIWKISNGGKNHG